MAVTEQCWEQCFRQVATETNRPILQEVLKTGYTIKRIKDIHGVQAITYLLDSTLATQCRDSSSSSSGSGSSSSSESGSWSNEIRNENATAIWKLQLQMMAIITAMAGSTKAFPVQFNENAAWACEEYSCLDCCQTFVLANSSLLSPVQTNSTACLDGLLEPACRLGYHGLLNYTCASNTAFKNNMTVAVLNSNAHSHVHKHGEYADYSPCHTFFDLRYALGLHNAQNDDLKRFETRDDYHNYMLDDAMTQAVVNQLFNCMAADCCPTPSTLPSASKCHIAYGHSGEKIASIPSIA